MFPRFNFSLAPKVGLSRFVNWLSDNSCQVRFITCKNISANLCKKDCEIIKPQKY